MNVIEMPQPERHTARANVAAEVRGQLAMRKIPTYKLAELLGGTESRGYWQRRISGELALNVDDLERLAELMGLRIIDFMKSASPQPHGPEDEDEMGGPRQARTDDPRIKGNSFEADIYGGDSPPPIADLDFERERRRPILAEVSA
jgi:hypothetical protein